MNKGDRARFFDALLWNMKDVGDNDQFWKPATVVNVQEGTYAGAPLVDIVFDHRPDQVSKGHFSTFTKPIEKVG
jgi:hypothetical protein